MHALRTLLEAQPMAALFLTIAIGYLVGQVNVHGMSLGVGAVLFVALAVGWFAPESVPVPAIGTLGLAIFLYAVGVQYGKEFFRGLTTAEGRRANSLALAGVFAAGAVTLALVRSGIALGYGLGLFAGSGTSTPTLQAAIQSLGNDDPAVGYSVAYPFGVAGPILLLQIAILILRPRIEVPANTDQELQEIAVRNRELVGKRVAEIAAELPAGVRIVAVRRDDRNQPAFPETILTEDSLVLAAGPNRQSLDQSQVLLGEAAPGRITGDRRDLDYLNVFVSRSVLIGRPLGELTAPDGIRFLVTHIRRGDVDLLTRPNLLLESGDRVGLLTERANFPAMRRFFGDSIKGTAEFSYVSIGLGLALGFFIGAIQVPLPGIGSLTIGLAGVLVVALVLGKLGHTYGVNWTIPLSANLVLRNLGLTLFLAQVGMTSGPKFAATVAETGLLFLGYGALILLALVLPILVLGHYVFRMPFDEVAGVVSAACGNAAILEFSNKLVRTERPDIAYAMIFPGVTVVKILFVDIVPTFFTG